MSTDNSQRRGRAFLLATGVLLVGLGDEVVGLTSFNVWSWLVPAGLAVAFGLRRLAAEHGWRRGVVR